MLDLMEAQWPSHQATDLKVGGSSLLILTLDTLLHIVTRV